MRMRIVGQNLPGRTFRPSAGERYENVHVGVQERADPVGLVAGDATGAAWDLDVRVVTADDRGLDFRGPVVHGKRGERFVYLTWGDVGADGSFRMFRRAKLMLDRVDPALVLPAARDGVLVATVDLSDEHGCPRCARVDPPAVAWSYAPVS
ncbi:MAG TPA: DUF5990 family protein [Acidimicrobiales bacterium]|jgi:hypothetical protein